MLADLPARCDVGTKTNSKGFKESWIGDKLHLDVADGMVPVSAVLTAASTHDSQAALPLARKSAGHRLALRLMEPPTMRVSLRTSGAGRVDIDTTPGVTPVCVPRSTASAAPQLIRIPDLMICAIGSGRPSVRGDYGSVLDAMLTRIGWRLFHGSGPLRGKGIGATRSAGAER